MNVLAPSHLYRRARRHGTSVRRSHRPVSYRAPWPTRYWTSSSWRPARSTVKPIRQHHSKSTDKRGSQQRGLIRRVPECCIHKGF